MAAPSAAVAPAEVVDGAGTAGADTVACAAAEGAGA
jgi:hypothetical protein